MLTIFFPPHWLAADVVRWCEEQPADYLAASWSTRTSIVVHLDSPRHTIVLVRGHVLTWLDPDHSHAHRHHNAPPTLYAPIPARPPAR